VVEKLGYRVKLAEGAWDRDDYVAGDPRRRGEDLNALSADPEIDVVQALQGGFGSAQAIPYLDFDLIAANPKPLVGYSDITALHVAIYGLPLGHAKHLAALPLGVACTLDADAKTLTVDEPALR